METIIAEILKYGLAGIFIAYLLWKNSQMEKQIDKLNETLLNYAQQVAKDNLDEHKNTLNELNKYNATLNDLKNIFYEFIKSKQ